MKLYVFLLSRNYDIFSGFDIRLAAQPAAATFSFGSTVVCFRATICAHVLDTAHAPSASVRSSLFSLSFWPHFLTCPAFNPDVNQILREIAYRIVFSYYIYSYIYSLDAKVRLHLPMRHLIISIHFKRDIESINQMKWWNIEIEWLIFREFCEINVSIWIYKYPWLSRIELWNHMVIACLPICKIQYN